MTTDYSDAEGAAVTRRVLAEDAPPTALVYDNDVMALAAASRRRPSWASRYRPTSR